VIRNFINAPDVITFQKIIGGGCAFSDCNCTAKQYILWRKAKKWAKEPDPDALEGWFQMRYQREALPLKQEIRALKDQVDLLEKEKDVISWSPPKTITITKVD
jgi:hypothetical protein